MPNPFHDENGKFSSKAGMTAAVERTAQAGNFDAMFELKNGLAVVEKKASVDAMVKEAVRRKSVARRSPGFFADSTTLDKRIAAKNSSTSTEQLVELSRDKDTIVRIGVSINPAAPQEVLQKLAKDKDWGVRSGVAKNPSSSEALLNQLASDENNWVVDEVKRNPSYNRA